MFTSLAKTWLAAEARVSQATASDTLSLAYLRILFGLFVMLYWWPSYSWLAGMPPAFFDPPPLSLVAFLSGFPGPAVLRAIDAVIIVSAVTLTIGLFTRTSTLLLFLALLTGNHFAYSFGKVDHGHVLRLCLLAVMFFANWGADLSVDSLRRRNRGHNGTGDGDRVDLRVLAALVAFGFFTSGFAKAVHWVDFDLTTSGFLNWLVPGYVGLGRDRLLAGAAMSVRPLWLWEFADLSAVVFELGFLVAMFHRGAWRSWLMIACLFHLSNLLFLNISFAGNCIVFLAFAPLRCVFGQSRTVVERPQALLAALTIVGVGSALAKIFVIPSGGGLISLVVRSAPGELLAGCGVCVVALMLLATAFVRETGLRRMSNARLVEHAAVSI